MADIPRDLIPTRRSLITRLKHWDDQESWNAFFETYWKLIYRAARSAGLSDAEAQDVVQETVISVCKQMPHFRYDPQAGSFQSWLLKLTYWRITDQFRRRRGAAALPEPADPDGDPDTAPITLSVAPELDRLWHDEWESNILAAALQRVKNQVEPKQYQLFDLYVLKQWPVTRITKTLEVSAGRVYLAKHRIGELLKQEVRRLETHPF